MIHFGAPFPFKLKIPSLRAKEATKYASFLCFICCRLKHWSIPKIYVFSFLLDRLACDIFSNLPDDSYRYACSMITLVDEVFGYFQNMFMHTLLHINIAPPQERYFWVCFIVVVRASNPTASMEFIGTRLHVLRLPFNTGLVFSTSTCTEDPIARQNANRNHWWVEIQKRCTLPQLPRKTILSRYGQNLASEKDWMRNRLHISRQRIPTF